ncbi:MAG: CPBP family intramembrane metalloprotease [Lachnospiraceae bacterium]|nr:CPBP family intramembrane metalloprotease [Lachnospiraceae bacterium]
MKNKWIHFNIDKENIFGLICGLIMVLLSIAMTLFDFEISNIILRDLLMILFLGFFTPLYYILIIKKKNLSVLGIHKNKLAASLAINVIAGSSLLAMFISKSTENLVFNINSFYAISYILVAGIFEMVFLYGFLCYEFERAFGILPSILITAIFYSLHHAGFQPEFAKLFFVGIMYATVFYFTRNIFSIFPFFWGVGAVWDVLVNSDAGNQIKNETSFIIAILMFIAMIGVSIFIHCKFKNFQTLHS